MRTDPASGSVVSGLCSAWRASADFRRWSFTCRSAPAIAAALRRLVGLREAPAHWLFARAQRISATGSTLVVRLRFPWRRFPYALTVVGAAPRSVPGAFRLVSGSAGRVVVQAPGLSVVFRRLAPLAAVREFRRGAIDEAPVPVGDVADLRARFGSDVRTRRLLGLDLVLFRALERDLRSVYWQTANRGDYEALVPETKGAAAFGIVASKAKADPARFRAAVKSILSLPRLRVRIGVPADATLRYAALLLYAQWRDVGLGPQLVGEHSRAPSGTFQRVLAAYPQEEAIPAELALHEGAGARGLLLHALGEASQRADLQLLDQQLRQAATVVPVAWVVDARLVSPRLVGWREDVLGNVDYAKVTSLASSRHP